MCSENRHVRGVVKHAVWGGKVVAVEDGNIVNGAVDVIPTKHCSVIENNFQKSEHLHVNYYLTIFFQIGPACRDFI